eukprot:TRINITY_DN312_c0_g1_i1.p1 TRINITY_DN312_c0_g1~~TRINITY_DN312_c0_g1_i1.p1  ORF type:complete len:155 (-),score=30.11 TRINITY_DN312_c0_g1_i1:367-831(-)
MSSILPEHLPPERVQEIRDVFNRFDKDKSETMSTSELATALRCAGLNPTEEEIQKLMEDVDVDTSGTLDFQEFLVLLTRKLSDSKTDTDLRDAFRTFDIQGFGTIPAAELRFILTTMGDKLSDEEANALIADADTDADGNIQYEDLAKKFFGRL